MTAVAAEAATLRITEIFLSLQGEANTVGRPTTFVRLTGCPLRCSYCDTAYAFSGGEVMSLNAIVDQVQQKGAQYVTVTGGEPLAQPACVELLRRLCDLGLCVSLETSGALDISEVDERVSRVVDLKTPGSAESARNDYDNIAHLRRHDQVKFVVCNRQDYEWARMKCEEYALARRVDDVLFSPSAEEMDAATLAGWILEDGLEVRFQIQLHKLLWGDVPGR